MSMGRSFVILTLGKRIKYLLKPVSWFKPQKFFGNHRNMTLNSNLLELTGAYFALSEF